MTEEERRVRLEVGAEIIEGVILDFLNENRGSHYSSSQVSAALGFQYNLCHGALLRLKEQGQVIDESTSRSHKWRIYVPSLTALP